MVALLSIITSLHKYAFFSYIAFILFEIGCDNLFMYDSISMKIKDKSEY